MRQQTGKSACPNPYIPTTYLHFFPVSNLHLSVQHGSSLFPGSQSSPSSTRKLPQNLSASGTTHNNQIIDITNRLRLKSRTFTPTNLPLKQKEDFAARTDLIALRLHSENFWKRQKKGSVICSQEGFLISCGKTFHLSCRVL